ncbi:MAG TPA: LamG-like jellyroll fold domain-containing protein [Pirellulales bacterium]|jgi:predicted phosphodiesterase
MLSCTLAASALLYGATLLHADHEEKDLLFHFAAGTHAIQNGAWQDMSHQATAQVFGTPRFVGCGPTEGLVFTGEEYLSLGKSYEDAKRLLPTRNMTVTAWIRLDDTEDRCGLISYINESRTQPQGWMLGFNRQTFVFGLAAANSVSTQNRMTYLPAKTPIVKGRWYYVAATYDGQIMRIYVNGELEGESNAQAGDIVYPAAGNYLLGGSIGVRSRTFMQGALFEAKCYARALEGNEIQKVAKKNENLIAWAPTPENDLIFLVQPYLQFATTDSITIMCETSRPAKMRVEYAELRPLELKAETASAQLISELTLKDLKPATRYFYRVVCVDETGQEVRGQQYSFQTAPNEDMPWAFAVIGDTQRNPEVTRKCAEGAFSKRPNFLLHCGDVVDDGFAKNQWLKDLFEPCSTLMAQIPTFPVIGNHEKDSHWYYDYFSLPKPEYYYTFRYGNAQFFMIDSNRPLDPGSPQYEWLEKELASSKAAWKFTCHHHPCFSSDENDYGDHVKGPPGHTFFYGDRNARKVVPLYEKYGVDIAFNGHIHLYERTWPIFEMAINQRQGVRYLTSGGGGGSLEQAAPQRTWFSLHFQSVFHYCYAAISDRTIVFKAYDIDGKLFDTFELTKAADR